MTAANSPTLNQINNYIKNLNIKIEKCTEKIYIKREACTKMQKMLEVDRWELSCFVMIYLSLPYDDDQKKELKKEILNAQESYKVAQKIFQQIVNEDYELSMQRKHLRSELLYIKKLNKNY